MLQDWKLATKILTLPPQHLSLHSVLSPLGQNLAEVAIFLTMAIWNHCTWTSDAFHFKENKKLFYLY